jgi:hypothetical protein
VVKLKEWARAIKRDVHTVYLAARDPRVPWYAKALALCVAAYALSPIDLIPDFIPVLGMTYAPGLPRCRPKLQRRCAAPLGGVPHLK